MAADLQCVLQDYSDQFNRDDKETVVQAVDNAHAYENVYGTALFGRMQHRKLWSRCRMSCTAINKIH